MSEEKQIYTKEELEEMSRVDLRKLAVKTWGMDNKECSGTKSQALRDWIIEQQEAYEGGGGDEKPAPKGRTGKPAARPSSGGKAARPRPSTGRAAPKSGAPKGRGRPAPKSEPEPDDEGQNEAPPAEDAGDLAERIDVLGKTIDDNHKELLEAVGNAGGGDVEGVKEALENMRLSLYILHGLVADIYRIHYEPEDLDSRVDELENEFNEEPEEGNE